MNIYKLISFILLSSLYITCWAKQNDSIMIKLNQVMNDKEKYIAYKEQKISKIKQILTDENISLYQKYEINKDLFNEYYKYSTDSAIVYMQNNRNIAFELNDIDKINESTLYLSLLYSTVGMYIQTHELLYGIDKNTLSESLLPIYYEIFAEFYSHYGQSNKVGAFYALSGQYRDSMLFALDTLSFQYRLESASRKMFTYYDLEQKENLLNLLEEAGNLKVKSHVAWLLGYMYHREIFEFRRTEYWDLSKKYYAMAVINDVENCVRDHASMQSLALVFFGQGEIALANKFIYSAFEDALACNVRFRIMDASTNYPLINDIFHQQEKKQISRLIWSLAAISFLFIVVIIFFLLFFRQNRKLSRTSRDLLQANNELEELHIVKNKFFSIVAHDLRSPVSSLVSVLELSNNELLDPKMQSKLLKDVTKRVNDVYGLLDNLLHWSKSQMQGMAPKPVFFDVQKESSAVTDTLHEIITFKGISLINNVEQQQVYADHDMFSVVIRNLVTNAIKYTGKGGSITLESELSDNMLNISVKDTGTGMSPEVQNKLFKLSETKSQSGTLNEKGTGLGLILCADFVKANGGKIWFNSKKGEGSTFFFSVPVTNG